MPCGGEEGRGSWLKNEKRFFPSSRLNDCQKKKKETTNNKKSANLKVNIGDNNIRPGLQESIRSESIVEGLGALGGNGLVIKLRSAILEVVERGFHGMHDRETDGSDVDVTRVVVFEGNQQFVLFTEVDD